MRMWEGWCMFPFTAYVSVSISCVPCLLSADQVLLINRGGSSGREWANSITCNDLKPFIKGGKP